MKKEFRIKKTQEIEEILNLKQSVSTKELRLFIKFTNEETSHFRYAISVGKKIGNAVNRNYQKRRLRSLFHQYQNLIPNNVCLFLIAKPEINKLDYENLEKQFRYLLEKSLKNQRRKQWDYFYKKISTKF